MEASGWQSDQIFDIISQFFKFLNDDPEETEVLFQSAKKASDGNEIDQISGCWWQICRWASQRKKKKDLSLWLLFPNWCLLCTWFSKAFPQERRACWSATHRTRFHKITSRPSLTTMPLKCRLIRTMVMVRLMMVMGILIDTINVWCLKGGEQGC